MLLAMSCLAQAAFAEGGCPAGQYPQQGPGWRTCVPIPGAQSFQGAQLEEGSRSTTSWITHWGAIAIDSNTASLGATTTATTESDAENEALTSCRNKGGKRCEIMITVQNACMAMVVGASRLNVKGGSTKEEAEARGMSICNEKDTNCAVYYSGCSVPIKLTR